MRFSFLIISILFLSSNAYTDVEETIKYIRSLLSENKRVAIFLIDMQVEYSQFFGGISNTQAEKIISDQAEIIRGVANEENIFIVNIESKGYGKTLTEIIQAIRSKKFFLSVIKEDLSAFKKGQIKSVEVLNQSGNENEMVINDDLENWLKKNSIKNIVATGCFDSMCVHATARDAVEKGFTTYVDRDANIIIDKRVIHKSTMSPSEILSQTKEKWLDLQHEFPNLIVADPVRYEPCDDGL